MVKLRWLTFVLFPQESQGFRGLDLLVVSGFLIAMDRYYTCEGDAEGSWATKKNQGVVWT